MNYYIIYIKGDDMRMQLIIVKKEDLTDEKHEIVIRIGAVTKKRKGAEKALLEIGKKYGVDDQWNILRNSGTGVAGGYRWSFVIKEVTEGVLYLNDAPLVNFFK